MSPMKLPRDRSKTAQLNLEVHLEQSATGLALPQCQDYLT
jgi:hypothetical protein